MVPNGVPEIKYFSSMTAFILEPNTNKRIVIFRTDIYGHLERAYKNH